MRIGKQMVRFAFFLLVLFLLAARENLQARPALTFDGALVSGYLYRGVERCSKPVLQAELDTAGERLSFNLWGNLDLTDENERRLAITETRLSLAYGTRIHPLDMVTGVMQSFEQERKSTREVFLHAAMLIPMNPALGIYYDFDRIEGMYLDVGGHHVVGMSRNVVLEFRAALGFGDAAANEEAFNYGSGALRDFNMGATLFLMIEEYTMVSIGCRYWSLVDPDLRSVVAENRQPLDGVIWQTALNHRF